MYGKNKRILYPSISIYQYNEYKKIKNEIVYIIYKIKKIHGHDSVIKFWIKKKKKYSNILWTEKNLIKITVAKSN